MTFDEGSFRPGIVLFTGHVSAGQTNQWQLTCDRMTAQLDPVSNRLEQLIAEPQARIVLQLRDDTVQAQGDRMRYWAAPAGGTFLEITGQPAWQGERFSGSCDRLLIGATRAGNTRPVDTSSSSCCPTNQRQASQPSRRASPPTASVWVISRLRSVPAKAP